MARTYNYGGFISLDEMKAMRWVRGETTASSEEKKKKKKALDYENHAIHMVQRLLVVSQLVCVKVT